MTELEKRNLMDRQHILPFVVKPIMLFVVCAAAHAQIYPPGGGYPGGQYPNGGGYPGQRTPSRVPSIPIPGRKKTSDAKNAGQPMPNFRGTLKQMDEKSLSLALGDNRVMDFRRNDKTKFFKNGDEVKPPKFNVGDQLSVEATEDPSSYLVAVNVYWEKGAGGSTSTSSKTEEGVDTWKDAPKSTQTPASDDPDRPVLRRGGSDTATAPAAPAPSRTPAKSSDEDADRPVLKRAASATETAPPPARRDADDPGPPVLKRGGAADPSRQRAPQYPDNPRVATNLPAPGGSQPEPNRPTVIRGDLDEETAARRQSPLRDEPLIRRAADAAMDFTEGLPSYVCTEAITRYQSETKPANFHALDVVTTDVVYENGKEDYRNVTVNGKKTTKSMEESGGAWSTGEFGTILINLFNASTAANFHYRKDSRVGAVMTKMYEFEVDRDRSAWSIHMGSQSYSPAYTGAVWIDPATARVLRIEMEAKAMPSDFPIDHAETATDYQYVRLGDAQQYLLPVHSEVLSCQRGTPYCSRNVIDFRNYHKYTGESSIKFGGETKDKEK